MNKKIAPLIKDVPLFFGLRQAEIATFLNICKLDTRASGQTLCECNAASNHLFVLLKGKLEIVDAGDLLLATILPVSTVGEMGFIGRRPRSAKVRVAATSQLLQVEHHEFEALLENHADLRAKIYRNTIRVLADRLTDANELLVRYKTREEAERLAREDAVDAEGKSDESTPAKETELGPAVGAETASDVGNTAAERIEPAGGNQDRCIELVRSFYAQLDLDVDLSQLGEESGIAAQMHADGHSYADIEYLIRWTARNIPSARRFNMVRLSIEEAFKDQWNL